MFLTRYLFPDGAAGHVMVILESVGRCSLVRVAGGKWISAAYVSLA